MIQATQLTGVFGARIRGLDCSAGLHDTTIREISAALKKYRVLVFPELSALTPEQHLAFAKRFGTEELPHPTWPDYPGCPGLKVISLDGSMYRDSWHTDGSTRKNTAWTSLLRAIEIPPYGRDTLFADMVTVYNRLSPRMQTFLEGLTAEHSWGLQKPDTPSVLHPVVMSDPVTGNKWVYVNRVYTRRILELTERESDAVLNYIYEQVRLPEAQLRVSWQPGMLVMWDNQQTQHYLIHDYKFPRVMHRVMVTPGVNAG